MLELRHCPNAGADIFDPGVCHGPLQAAPGRGSIYSFSRGVGYLEVQGSAHLKNDVRTRALRTPKKGVWSKANTSCGASAACQVGRLIGWKVALPASCVSPL